MNPHRFFHADRSCTLSPRTVIELDADGLSRFGQVYTPAFSELEGQIDTAAFRELQIEMVRREPAFIEKRPSRLSSIFAALTIDEALWHGRNILPHSNNPFPIYEIFSNDFVTLDRNWMDYNSNADRRIENYRSYWWGEISNHNPLVGERMPPRLEVLIKLPAQVGEIVAWACSRE